MNHVCHVRERSRALDPCHSEGSGVARSSGLQVAVGARGVPSSISRVFSTATSRNHDCSLPLESRPLAYGYLEQRGEEGSRVEITVAVVSREGLAAERRGLDWRAVAKTSGGGRTVGHDPKTGEQPVALEQAPGGVRAPSGVSP